MHEEKCLKTMNVIRYYYYIEVQIFNVTRYFKHHHIVYTRYMYIYTTWTNEYIPHFISLVGIVQAIGFICMYCQLLA